MAAEPKIKPYFEMCECGKHGRIVAATGFKSPEIPDKAFGRHMVRTADEFEQLTAEEMPGILQQILGSPLPEGPEQADLVLLFRVELFNKMRANIGDAVNFDSASTHTIIFSPKVSRAEIPPDFLEVLKRTLASSGPN